MLSEKLLMAQLKTTPEAILQSLSGSGTFTPLYPGVPAIIQISGGGGGGGASVWAFADTGSTPSSGRSARSVEFFVPDIDVFSGGSYIVGGGGGGGSLCSTSNNDDDGNTGGTSRLFSPSSTPWNPNMPGGGRGRGSGSAASTASASGSWPTAPYADLPEVIVLDGVEIDPNTLLNIGSASGGSSDIGFGTDDGPNGSRGPGCAFAQSGGNGWVRIYYLT